MKPLGKTIELRSISEATRFDNQERDWGHSDSTRISPRNRCCLTEQPIVINSIAAGLCKIQIKIQKTHPGLVQDDDWNLLR